MLIVNTVFLSPACQCYGRGSGCVYNSTVDEMNLSIDIHGFYSGGGVCQNCQVGVIGSPITLCTFAKTGSLQDLGLKLRMYKTIDKA